MLKKGQSSLGRFSQIGYKTRYELQIFKSPFRVLATHWKTNIEIRLTLLFSLFLAVKNLRNRIISENLILISLFGEISPVIFLKKRATAGGFRRWWCPLNVHVIRFSRWVIDDNDNNDNNSHVSHDAIGTVARHLSTNKTTHANIHVSLPRRSRSSSNIHSCLPSHDDVIGSLSRTFSRHSCRQRRDSTGRRTLKTLVFFFSFSVSLSLSLSFAYVWPGPLLVGVMYLLIAD